MGVTNNRAVPAGGKTGSLRPKAFLMTSNDASRFLSQAAFGGTEQEIIALQNIGISSWLEQQFTKPSDLGHWDWLMAKNYNAAANITTAAGIDASLYRKLMSSPDLLRQRVALALSEIFVISTHGLNGSWRAFSSAAYMDMLATQAFGNFRTLLEAVTLSPAMGVYLGTRGNTKEVPGGHQADENFAREIMQLFTIGLVPLNPDGTLNTNEAASTYSADDVTQLARVFTGWDFDRVGDGKLPDYWRRNMVMNATRHSISSKTFLKKAIPPGIDGVAELKIVLDILFNHANVAPFFCRQLIQRLVTSNPSPAYVQRVAKVFIVNENNQRGDLKSVISAILQDPEARSVASGPAGGKLREPMLRYVQWARSFKVKSNSDNWLLSDTADPDQRLGQSPLRAPSVFNFFRPGYVPPGSGWPHPALVAPELQITTETTVVGYANFMLRMITGGNASPFPDLVADYSAELALVQDSVGLLNHLNLILACGQVSATNINALAVALDTIPLGSDADKLNRVKAAILMILCAPEYLVLK